MGFFKYKNFHELAFPRFLRGKFSQIVTDCKEYLLKSKHFEGKIFKNRFQFVKITKIFPLENNPLYGSYESSRRANSAFFPLLRVLTSMHCNYIPVFKIMFLNQARAGHTWFLIITFVCESMRACMCVYAPEAINN